MKLVEMRNNPKFIADAIELVKRVHNMYPSATVYVDTDFTEPDDKIFLLVSSIDNTQLRQINLNGLDSVLIDPDETLYDGVYINAIPTLEKKDIPGGDIAEV